SEPVHEIRERLAVDLELAARRRHRMLFRIFPERLQVHEAVVVAVVPRDVIDPLLLELANGNAALLRLALDAVIRKVLPGDGAERLPGPAVLLPHPRIGDLVDDLLLPGPGLDQLRIDAE